MKKTVSCKGDCLFSYAEIERVYCQVPVLLKVYEKLVLVVIKTFL